MDDSGGDRNGDSGGDRGGDSGGDRGGDRDCILMTISFSGRIFIMVSAMITTSTGNIRFLRAGTNEYKTNFLAESYNVILCLSDITREPRIACISIEVPV